MLLRSKTVKGIGHFSHQRSSKKKHFLSFSFISQFNCNVWNGSRRNEKGKWTDIGQLPWIPYGLCALFVCQWVAEISLAVVKCFSFLWKQYVSPDQWDGISSKMSNKWFRLSVWFTLEYCLWNSFADFFYSNSLRLFKSSFCSSKSHNKG